MAGTVITNKGVALIAKLLASGQELIFTRAAVGTGRLPGGFSPQNMTGLVEYKKDGDIAACSSSGDIASVIFQISSIGVTEGFTVTEVGLFATDPDDGEILYSYMDLSEDPQYIYAEGGAVSKFAEIELQTVIGQLEKVTAYINPGSLLTNDGDISNTEIGALDVITESFPVPAAKEKSRKFFGKVKKSMEDWKNLKTGLITTGKLINNGLCTEAGFALDARFGKNLQDQITTQNNNLNKIVVPCDSVELGIYNTDFTYISWKNDNIRYQLQFLTNGVIQLRKYDHNTSMWADLWSSPTKADLDNKTPMNGKLITTSIKTAVLSNPAVSFGVFAFSLSPDAPPNLESGFVMYFRHNNLTLNTTLVALYGNVMVYGRIEGNNLRWF